MELLEQPGGNVYVAEAPTWDTSNHALVRNDHLVIGITKDALVALASRGLSAGLGQLYGVVCPGLISVQHLFRGLRRGMMVDQNSNAAPGRLAASWAQSRDCILVGSRHNPELEYLEAPRNCVFVVAISRNEMVEAFPQIYGWIDHWTWVAADPDEFGAPIDWRTRYDERIWTAMQPG